MPIVSILTFFVTFIFIVWLGSFIFLIFYNKRSRAATKKFVLQTGELKPVVINNVKLRYWITPKNTKTMLSPNNYCDLYLFDNFLAIIRRQDFILEIFFAPVLLTADLVTAKNKFNYLDCYKPDYIHFSQHVKGQVDIKVKDPIYKHWKIDITLKGLSDVQIGQLEKILNLC